MVSCVPDESSSPVSRAITVAVTVLLYVVAVVVLFRPTQLRIWNNLGTIDVVVMTCLVLPYLILPRFERFRPRVRVTRYAWWISAFMALDVLFFATIVLGPFGSGHPSIEALGSYFLGLAKMILVPATLVLLAIAGLKGERPILVVLGFICLAAETLYTVRPTA